ncbi:hypothetical protein V6N12_000722 [Hibiscus sabdariffa]|uniref:Uncharacterized protein n=1 Tax=Hibiscus sabdariffa TaxID=183260 RepID=A0ABR2BYJ6_9ROSI
MRIERRKTIIIIGEKDTKIKERKGKERKGRRDTGGSGSSISSWMHEYGNLMLFQVSETSPGRGRDGDG